MKPINFITAQSVQEQQELSRWYYISIGLLSIMVTGISMLQAYQLFVAYTLRKDYQKAHRQFTKKSTLHAKMTTLQQQVDCLQKQTTLTQTLRTHHEMFLTQITALTTLNTSTSQLTSCTLTPTTAQFALQCPQPRAAFGTLSLCAHLPHIKNVKLVCLQPIQPIPTCTVNIQGTIDSSEVIV